MALSPMGHALKSETAELRSRSVQLRQSSRDLQRRSQDCRRRIAEVVARTVDDAEAAVPAKPYVARLMRAEADLEGAIAECRVALDEVRRELAWREAVPFPVVH